MDRVVIAISELNKEVWTIIYQFIKSVVFEADNVSKNESYQELIKIAKGVRLKTGVSPDNASDVFSLYGETICGINKLSKETCFSIIYNKNDDREDFAELVPFTLLQHEFGAAVSLGIDICNLREPESYYFKCSDFFFLHQNIKPKLGERSIYFIEEANDEKTGETILVTNSLAGKGNEGDSKYQGNISRRFLPLIHITEDNYDELFFEEGKGDSIEYRFVKKGIEKIKTDLKNTFHFELEKSLNSDSPFGQWLEAAYYYSYDKNELKGLCDKKIEGISNTLQVFKDSIQELIQNIIVHGGKTGMLYCVFDKKVNVSDCVSKAIPDFNDYDESSRFLRMGVFDFGEEGIVDTFIRSNQNDDDTAIKVKGRVELTDFFNINSIVTTGLTRLDMRYAAHMGIKTFVKTIVDHKGYFSVESCEHIEGRKIKRSLHTKDDSFLSKEVSVNFVRGTHYEIILPVIESENQESGSVLVQTTSVSKKFSGLLRDSYPLLSAKITQEVIDEIGLCKEKQEQKKNIVSICNEIIDKCCIDTKEEKERGIALDLGSRFVSPSIIFKIAAYLQLHLKTPLKRIVLVNVTSTFTKEFCSLIHKFLINQDNDKMPVWSKNCALVILCDDLHARIVWGGNKDELYYINREYKRLYYNHFLDVDGTKDENLFDKDHCEIKSYIRKKANKFVLPYDVLINTEGQGENHILVSPFERFLDQLLRRKIVSDKPGLSVNHKYTFIGRKIIVKNYYEADSLFQNNFFVERFAYLIARNIKNVVSAENDKYGKKTIVLIGYKYYSEFLLKTIQDQMKPDYTIRLGICNEGKDFCDNNVTFNFGLNGDEKKTELEILTNPNEFLFSTIVPIGATLSTNDKIISFFKLWLEKNKKNKASIEELQFFYNHCAIVVRDKIGESNTPTPIEIEQKWDKIYLAERIITTRYRNANKVYYTIQIAERDKLEKGNWIKRLNDGISFPKDWRKEKYINLTENSSINSQNFLDYPKVDTDNCNEEENLDHIYQLKNYIYKGHIKILNRHHKFYIDTESFVIQKKTLVKNWLNSLEKNMIIGQDALNVLVTPNVKSASDFVRAVNEYIFDGSALIIYLDVNNWRNNNVNKLSFLQKISNVRFHYVDQAFLTGETYHKAKSYLFSIVDKEDAGFYTAFAMVNRMTYAKSKEIKKELKLFAYANLYYPLSKETEQECELCRLNNYYENLNKKTVLESCTEVIHKNKDKINADIDELKKRSKEKGNEYDEWKKRIFLRLVIAHWLFYKISKVPDTDGFEIKKENVKKELDNIYSSLCGESEQDNCLLNQKIDQWLNHSFNHDLFSKVEDKVLTLDKKISFLKVISSPPLSQYIAIREYAHERLLDDLNKVLDKKGQFCVDDLKVVKSILKSLSFLKSNALVRKDVIVGVWKVLEGAIKEMDDDGKRDTVQDFSKDVQFFVKNAIAEDESKATFLGELLRRGEEMTSFNTIMISGTRLVLTNDDSEKTVQNELFNAFNDCEYHILKREYSSFLVWLFYDNTTIIRNTYANFYRELDKDERIYKSFYDGKNLKSITVFKKNINETKKLFIDKIVDESVESEYYYSSFKPYLKNGDDIDFVEKLIYVTYAKLKLEDLTTDKHMTCIESDTCDLMEVFSAIMGADAAFWTMKKETNKDTEKAKETSKRGTNKDTDKVKERADNYRIYPISLYDKDSDKGWDYDNYNFNLNTYYSYQIFTPKKFYYPLIPYYSIKQVHGERKDLKKHSLGVYAISENLDEKESNDKKKKIVSGITFLYKDSSPIVSNEVKFRIQFQESGRLLLLLKKEIDTYAVGYLLQEKAFELWETAHLGLRRFKKIYDNSSHVFNQVYKEMEEFEKLNKDTIMQLSKTWFFLSNETISFLYSSIENNPKHCLYIDPSIVVDEENTIGKTFSESFIFILSALLNSRWKDEKGNIRNAIYINNLSLDEYKVEEKYRNEKIIYNRHLLRTIIAQCLNNSLYSKAQGNGGHRYSNEIKRVDISLDESEIVIKDSSLIKVLEIEESKVVDARRFARKKKFIKKLLCDEYSSTTLTTLQGVANYLGFSCNYHYNKDNNFEVSIKFK